MAAPTQGTYEIWMKLRDEATGRIQTASRLQTVSMKQAAAAMQGNFTTIGKSSEKMGTDYSKASKMMRLHTEGLRREIGALRNMFLLYAFALRPIVGFMNEIISASMRQEQANLRLEFIMTKLRGATSEQINNLKLYARQLQLVTTYGDEEIQSAMSMLATFNLTAKEIKEAIPRVLDMARGVQKLGEEQMSLEQIAKIVGKAVSGQVGQLGRYVGKMDESMKITSDFSGVMRLIDEHYKDLSKSTGSYSDQLAQLRNNMGDLKEALGDALLPVLKETTSVLSDVIKYHKLLNEIAERGGQRQKVWTDDVKLFAHWLTNVWKTVDPLGASLNYTISQFEQWKTTLHENVVELEKIVIILDEKMPEAIRKVPFSEVVENWFKDIKSLETLSADVAKSMADSFSTFFFDLITNELKTLEDYWKSFSRTVLKMITDIMAQMLVARAVGFLGGPGALFKHSGGAISSSMRRFHPGGIAGDEVPAILQTGEGVLSRTGMRALSALNRGDTLGARGADTYIIINAIDTESFRERLTRHGDIYEAAAVGGISRNSELRRKLKGLF